MSHHHHGHALGAAALIGAIAFAFGPRVARIVVGTVLVLGGSFFGGLIGLALIGWFN